MYIGIDGITGCYLGVVALDGAILDSIQVCDIGEIPTAIIDFSASDNEELQVTMTWTDSTVITPKYDLYENGIKIATDISSGYIHEVDVGTREYYVIAYNNAGETESNRDNGASLAEGIPPSAPTAGFYFSASDNQVEQVTMTIGDPGGYPTPRLDVYKDGVLIKTGAYNGWVHSRTAGTSSYYVKAVNSEGSADSIANNGTAIASVPATPQTTKVWTNNTTWQCPHDVTSVLLCMIGGGGSGATAIWTSQSDENPQAGGGYAGNSMHKTVSVTPGATYTISIGAGGTALTANSGSGRTGGSSAFGNNVAGGGGGGLFHGNFKGNGGTVAYCYGTYFNGTYSVANHYRGWGVSTAYGGQAGFSKGGNGTASAQPTGQTGGTGAGGGAAVSSDGLSGVNKSGAGGKGLVRISYKGN